jgi:hypothetical protein
MVHSSKTIPNMSRPRVAASIPACRDWGWCHRPMATPSFATVVCVPSSVICPPSSVFRPPVNGPSCPSYQLARKQKNFFYQTNPNLLDRTRLTNPFFTTVYEAKAPFSLSRKRTQTARKKTFFTKRTQIFLVDKDHKSFFHKGLRSQACILPIKKTNPNEPKLTEQKNFFYETNPNSPSLFSLRFHRRF